MKRLRLFNLYKNIIKMIDESDSDNRVSEK